MTPDQLLWQRLAQPSDTKMVLLVLDGVGDLRTRAQPETALMKAACPNLDRLADRGCSGRLIPVTQGITPGSGPGHLALFGYDPRQTENDIGRGVLEALGLAIDFDATDVLARGNFATADPNGDLTDRRAGRISTQTCRDLCSRINAVLRDSSIGARVHPGEGHRFVLVLTGENLDPRVSETDPQTLGVPPREPKPLGPAAAATADLVAAFIAAAHQALADEPQANRVTLRGFSQRPQLPQLPEIFGARFGAFAGYPLYRGVAAACGMADMPADKDFAGLVDDVARSWEDFDFFFLHVKQTDQAGEDGDLAAKVEVLEHVDHHLPRLLDLNPSVIAVTGDHSTPAPMRGHSWHPVPVVLSGDNCFNDETTRFDELQALRGHLGTIPATSLMGLLFAHAGRLAKFGA